MKHAALPLALALATTAAAQITTIPAMTVNSTQLDFDGMPLGPTTVAAINAFYGTNIVDITPIMPLAADGNYSVGLGLQRALGFETGMTGNLALIDPGQNFGAGNGYRIELGQPSTEVGLSLGDYVNVKDVLFYDAMGTMIGMSTVDGSTPVTVMFYQSATPFTAVEVSGPPNYVLPEIWIESGTSCSVTTPMSPAAGDIQIDFDVTSPFSMTTDLTFEFSTDSGMTYLPCTSAATSPLGNPALGTPTGMSTFLWDSVADSVGTLAAQMGVLVRVTVLDPLAPPPGTATCETMPFDVDNVNPPACTITTPAMTAGGGIAFPLDLVSPNAPGLDVTLEFSIDSGATYALCTAAAASSIPNPGMGVPPGMTTFVWDSRADMVGMMALVPGVLVRATLDDGVVTVQGTCQTAPFDVDNTALCQGICGDCDLNAAGPDVLDALTAAQIAAALVTPMGMQVGCCDVDSSMTISVLDALGIAQAAAGLMFTPMCP